MTRRSKACTAFGAAAAVTLLAGCGAPDLSAMHPQVKKSSAVIFYVNQPNIEYSASGLNNDDEGTMVYKTIQSSASGFQAQLASTLAHDSVSVIVIVVDNAVPYAAYVSQMANQYSNVRFDVISDTPGNFTASSNLHTVSSDPDLVAYAIGYLVGTYLSAPSSQSTVNSTYGVPMQPILGYLPGTAPKDEQEAFFAGLYTSDAIANVVALVPASGSTASAPVYPTVNAVVMNSTPSQPTIAALSPQTSTFFSFGGPVTGVASLIGEGHLASSNVDKAISEIETGQWQSGSEKKIDLSSITLKSSALPSSVSKMWGSLQPTLFSSSLHWQQRFQSLPKSTRTFLSTQFGLS